MSLYLIINLASLSVPFLVSFHPRLQLHKKWKFLFAAIILALTPYIIWDIIFTDIGIWGFNPAYLSGIYLFNLPLEEWLFFICIPYACVFTHYALLELKRVEISQKITQVITVTLLIFFAILGVMFFKNAYTLWDAIFAFVILLTVRLSNPKLLSTFYYTFLYMLIPFVIVNGILTGSGIENEVVWYNNEENIGKRFFSIPYEDFIYAFSLILLNLFLFEMFLKRNKKVVISQPKAEKAPLEVE